MAKMHRRQDSGAANAEPNLAPGTQTLLELDLTSDLAVS